MRYVLVSNDSNPVFYNHPQGQLLCLPLTTTQDVMKENFNERFRMMRCGDSIFVFQQYDNLCFMVVTDQGDSETFLRRQLHMLYNLLAFLFGPRYPFLIFFKFFLIFIQKINIIFKKDLRGASGAQAAEFSAASRAD
jgi:hypothetical protein